MQPIQLLFVTIPATAADDFVKALCQERMIACGNVLSGARSHYWWDGEVQSDDEAIVLMETATARTAAAMKRIVELHPYDVPKVIALDPAGVLAAYAQWVAAETSPRT